MKNYLMVRAVPPLGAALIRLVRMTMRMESAFRSQWKELEGEDEGVIFALWHNRMLMMPYAVRGRQVISLISRHRDGELISRTIASFGYESVRGSSSRGGGRAMIRMRSLLKEGKDVAITPDGPRGPRYRVQPGIVQLARVSGRPIYPLTFASSRFFRFNSWDRFRVPKLFSRGVFLWGEPLRVSPSDDLQLKAKELEEALHGITRRADCWFSRESPRVESPDSIGRS